MCKTPAFFSRRAMFEGRGGRIVHGHYVFSVAANVNAWMSPKNFTDFTQTFFVCHAQAWAHVVHTQQNPPSQNKSCCPIAGVAGGSRLTSARGRFSLCRNT